MQQAPNFLGGVDEQARFLRRAAADGLRARECVFERARQVGKVGKSDRRRAAGQRVRQRDRNFTDRPMQFHRPFGEFSRQAARQFVGFVQVDVEQRDADAQRPDRLDRFIVALIGQRRRFVLDRDLGQGDRARREPTRLAGRGAGGIGRFEQQIGSVRLGRDHHARGFARLAWRRGSVLPAQVEVDHLDRDVGHRLVDRGRQLQRVGWAEVERIEQRRSARWPGQGRCRGRRARWRGRVVADREVEVERKFQRRQACRLARLKGRKRPGGRLGGRGWRGLLRRRRAARDGDWIDARLLQRARLDGAGAVLVRTPRGDLLHPFAEVLQRPLGELQQVPTGGTLFSQTGVVELLADPGRLAEVFQPDHARTALERMERASDRRQDRQFTGVVAQLGQGIRGVADDFARFLQEDFAQLVVFDSLGHRRLRGRCGLGRHGASGDLRCHDGGRGGAFERRHLGVRRHEVRHRLAHHFARGGNAGAVGGVDQGLLRVARGPCQAGTVGRARAPGEPLQAEHQLGGRNFLLVRVVRQLPRLIDQLLLERTPGQRSVGRQLGVVVASPHDRLQQPGVGVVGEQRLGHLRLHAEHVDQEAQGAEVSGQAFEHPSLRRMRQVGVGGRQTIHLFAHLRQGRRGVVHAEHGQHAAHRRQVLGHLLQRLRLARVAEELVDELFGCRQRGAQFLDHAAHRLLVRHAPVQLFHPRLERLRRLALAHLEHALGQTRDALGLLRMVKVGVFENSVDVEQAGRHFHRQRRRRRGIRVERRSRRVVQSLRERFAQREQALERVADQRKLLGQTAQAVHLAASDRRPGVLRSRDAFARLRHPRRVKTPEVAGGVVDRFALLQAVSLASRGQARCRRGRRARLRAKEQQVQRKAFRNVDFALRQAAKLREQPRPQAFAEHVESQQALPLRFEHRGGKLPAVDDLRVFGRLRDAGKGIAEALGGVAGFVGTHQHQQFPLDRGAHRGIGRAHLRRVIGGHFEPAPRHVPQVSRVDPVRTSVLLHGAVLRKQRERRHRLAAEHAAGVVEQRE